jgi:hypothetical protein
MAVKEQRVFLTTKYTSVSFTKQGMQLPVNGSLNCMSSQARLSKLNFCTKSKSDDPSFPLVYRDYSLPLLHSFGCKL